MNFVKPDDSDHHFLNPSRAGIAAQRLDDRQLRRLGAGRLAHMQGAPIRSAEGRGHPALAGEEVTHGRPAVADAVRAQAATDQLHELIGQHRDEQVAVDPRLGAVIDRNR